MVLGIIFIVLIIIIILFFVILSIIRIYNKSKVKYCTSNVQLNGKTVIVTGASAGVGKAAAKDFAKRGARVILACRNLEKAQRVAADIINTTGNTNVFVRLLDTSSLSSVRDFAKDTLKREDRLDILVLNAGILGRKERLLTEDGLELTMASNHFGHFLLVNLLTNLLKKSSPSRVVVTASSIQSMLSKINPKDLNFNTEDYSTIRAYGLSKLCNVLMTKYLAVYFLEKGVTINCLCPGLVFTEIFEKSTHFIFRTLYKPFIPYLGRTVEEGAQTIIYLAVSEDIKDVSGAFFMDCEIKKTNPLAEDAGLIRKIWEKSEELVQLTPEERSYRANPTL